MAKMVRRMRNDQVVYGRDLNRFLDVVLGNSEGRISLLDDDGDELDLHDGSVVSSNNYSLWSRNAAGQHGRFQHSGAASDVLLIQDAGITANAATVTGTTTLNGAVTLGDAAGDAITVNGTLTVNANATFNVNVTLGDASGDTITINGTPTFQAAAQFNALATFAAGATVSSGVLTIPVGSAAAPSLAVGESNTGLFRQAVGALGLTAGGTERARVTSAGIVVVAGHVTVPNNSAYRVTEAGGTIRNALLLTTGDILQIGINLFGEIQLEANSDLRLRVNTVDRIRMDGTGIGVFATTPVAKQTVTGSRGGNAALANFLGAMANYGWITDSTTA